MTNEFESSQYQRATLWPGSVGLELHQQEQWKTFPQPGSSWTLCIWRLGQGCAVKWIYCCFTYTSSLLMGDMWKWLLKKAVTFNFLNTSFKIFTGFHPDDLLLVLLTQNINFLDGMVSCKLVYLPPRTFTDGKRNVIMKKKKTSILWIRGPLCVAHSVQKAWNFYSASKLLLALGNLWQSYCMSHSSDLTALYWENWRVPFEGLTCDHYFLRAAAFVHRHSRLLQSRSTSVHT